MIDLEFKENSKVELTEESKKKVHNLRFLPVEEKLVGPKRTEKEILNDEKCWNK